MNELLLVIVLVCCVALSFVSYIVFIELRKNRKLHKINDRGRKLIQAEMELDKNDAEAKEL